MPMLVRHYLRRFSRELGREVVEVAPEAIELLRAYSWPGNIRELQSVLKQALLQARGKTLLPAYLKALEGESSGSVLAPAFADESLELGVFIRLCLSSDDGILDLASERLRVGTTNKLDVEQAKTVLEQTRSTIPALEIQQGQANDSLCILTGIPPEDLNAKLGAGPDLGNSPMPNTPTWVAPGIPAELLRRRPDVRGAERLVAAQSANRCRRGRLVPVPLYQWHSRLGCTGLFESVRDEQFHWANHSWVSVEYPELRADQEQRSPPRSPGR